MSTLSIHFPGKLVFGNGCLTQLPDEIASHTTGRVFIVTIAPLLPALKGLIESLGKKGIHVVTNTAIVREPSFEDFHRIMAEATPFDPDIVIGVGGGSVLDISKL